MSDGHKTEDELINELKGLHQRIAELEKSESMHIKRLTESEALYRQLVESPLVGVWQADTKGRFVFVNRRLAEMTGYEQDEVVGMSMMVPIAPELRPWLFERMQKRIAGQLPPDVVEVEMVRKDRSRYSALVAPAALYDEKGEYIGFIGAMIDISDRKKSEHALQRAQDELEKRVEERTAELEKVNEELYLEINERRQAEEALMKSEKSYRELINNITDFIYSHDLAGRFTMVNRTAAETLGYLREELIGRPISDFMLPEHRQTFKEEYLTQIKEKGSLGGLSIYLAKDGSKRYIEYRNVLVKQEGMEPFVSGSGRDITEKVLSDRKVHRLEEQLQRAQKMEAIGTLAGGVAHDLNNVLSGIVSYPDLLLMELPEESPLIKPLLTIQKSGKKAADIVQDLLTLARRGVVATEVANLNQIINSYLRSPECENLKKFYPDAKIESDLEMNLLNIMGSPIHLSKSFMNLVNNAAEAMPYGGNIFISTESRYIDKPLRGYDDVEEGDYVILKISDTGMGISSEDMERIFEPFYTKKVMGRSGTGLGMAVVWGTVKDHKGYIDVQSTQGKGTTFTLYFPVTRKEIAGREEALPIEEYMGKGESILVVDDIEEQCEIASRILNKLGYSATSVSSGEDAVNYVKDNSADLLVLDMIMDPGIDGLDTYKRILELYPGQKAIIASGFSETDRVKEAQRLGAGKYIKKPYTLEKIGLAVKEELGK